ncbi:MAG: hypothetical protein AC479_08030 [miscellaneous Crenarchaeota group-6 archaeon AD8-1]|nr:MAG: hypothetical protein AC479_08030 [miscellaneous Crenarchaeota group-6 archaeon AD8-1]
MKIFPLFAMQAYFNYNVRYFCFSFFILNLEIILNDAFDYFFQDYLRNNILIFDIYQKNN